MKFLCALVVIFYVGVCLAAPTAVQPKVVETDPELTAGYFEGDMVLDGKRNGIKNETYRWPNNVVYYAFHGDLDAAHVNHVLHGMRNIEAVSCIRFREAGQGQRYFVNITGMPGGCYSSVGWLNRVQTYNLQVYPLDTGCFRMGTIMHEFLHTLGFYHQQSASNRDDYVRIAEENIQAGTIHNFNKYDATTVDDFGEIYDYGSVLHYSAYAFSDNGEMTIIPLREAEAAGVMGQRREMSKSDINKLNIMHRCPLRV